MIMNNDVVTFNIGEPEIFSPHDFIDMLSCQTIDGYYAPPVSYDTLTKLPRLNTHHESALDCKKNILSSIFKDTHFLDYESCEAFIADYLIFGNAYLEPVKSLVGNTIRYRHVMAKYTRVGTDGNYYFLQNFGEKIKKNNLIHVKAYDVNQNVYGIPPYLSAMLNIALNHAGTLFRYKYYKNGSHAGFILAINGHVSDKGMKTIEETLKKTKQSGNFNNLLVHLPKGDKDSVQLIPISQIAAKDEFVNIKDVSRDDIATVHRVPLVLMSIQASNAGGFGNPAPFAKVFYKNELYPMIRKFYSVNHRLGQKIFDFDKYDLEES
ncbi:phage portal protein [Wohlfahrtiimonas sp. G9077]|nr:phage portal protein [Wohlfahrtiimonas sp. G9077]